MPPRISQSEMRDALLRSGYLLETRVEERLTRAGYYAQANSPYRDPDTSKSREIDVHAISGCRVGPDEYDFLFHILVIECINNPQPLALITREPLTGFLHHQDIKWSGIPVKVLEKSKGDTWLPLSDFLAMNKYHHYCRGRVATQFCSFQTKKSGGAWLALHEGSHFDAFQKLCDAIDHSVDEHFAGWTFGPRESLNLQLYYPLLILQGDLVEVRQTKRSLRIDSASHLQFRRSTIRDGNERTYQIDVVTERYLPRYLRLLDSEVQKTRRLLRRRHQIIRRSIDRIAERCKRLRSPEKIRKEMEF